MRDYRKVPLHKMKAITRALARRFPDLPERDVIEHVEYVFNTTIPERSVQEWEILNEYNKTK